MGRDRGDGLVHFLTPATAAAEHKRRRVGQVGYGPGPAADQRGDVLARLEAPEVRHVRLTVQAEPVGHLAHPLRGRPVEQGVVHAVVGHVDPGWVGAKHPDQFVPGGLRRHEQPGGPPGGGADRGLEKGRRDRVVRVRLGEVRQVVDGRDHGHAGPQRHGVVRCVQDVGVDLLGDEWEAGLLPGEPRGPVRDRGRASHDGRFRHEPAVPLFVIALGRHREVRSGCAQRGDQAIHVPAQRATVRRHGGRVNQHPRCHEQSFSFPPRAGACCHYREAS